jgi:hypothetical protein
VKYYVVRFIGRYTVAIIITFVAWIIFAVLGWTGVYADLVLVAIGLSLGLTFRRGAIEAEALARAEIERRVNRLNSDPRK